MKCPLFRSGLGARCLPGGKHEWLPEGRRGADDEDPRSDFTSDGEEDYVVAGCGDHRDYRPADAAVAMRGSAGQIVRAGWAPGGGNPCPLGPPAGVGAMGFLLLAVADL